MKKTVILLLIIIGLAFIQGPGSVRAEEGPEKAAAEDRQIADDSFEILLYPGYHNVYRVGKHMPLTVQMTSVQDFEGWIRWIVPGTEGVSALALEKKIQVKAGEEMVFRMVAAPQWGISTVRFQLLDQAQKKILEKDVPVDRAEDMDLLIGILTEDLTAFRHLDGLSLPLQGYYGYQSRIVRLSEEDFPIDGSALESLSLLIVDPAVEGRLDEKQKELLDSWGSKGRPQIRLTDGPKSVQESEIREALNSGLPWAESTISALYGFYNYYYLADYLEDRFAVEAPDFVGMILLFVAFILLICPVMYLILKKIDRRELYLAAVPLAALLTTLLLFVIYRDLRIRVPKEATFVQKEYDMELQEQTEKTYSLLLSPETGTTDFDLDTAAAEMTVYSADDVDYYEIYNKPQVEDFEPRILLSEKEDTVAMRVDDQKPFEKTWVETAGEPGSSEPGLEVHLTKTLGGVKGEITNRTGYDLSMVSVYTAERAVLVGPMKKDETVSFDRSEDLQQVLEGWYENKMPGEDNENESSNQKMSLMTFVLSDRVYNMGEDEAFTFCYIDHYDESLSDPKKMDVSSSAAILRRDPIAYEDYPTAYTVNFMDHLDSADAAIDSDGQMLDTEAEAVYRLPAGRVIAFIRGEAKTGDSSESEVLFYNWKSQAFEEVFTGQENTVTDTAPYIWEDGVVRVRYQRLKAYDYIPILRAVMEGGQGHAEG